MVPNLNGVPTKLYLNLRGVVRYEIVRWAIFLLKDILPLHEFCQFSFML
jgi:hypothetical protein